MGIRCTQIFGLTEEATNHLEANCALEISKRCPHCDEPIGWKWIQREYKDAKEEGMFDDGPMLFEYTMKDNSKLREVIQTSPWSSGPCIFLCLEDEKGNRLFEWDQKEIDNA